MALKSDPNGYPSVPTGARQMTPEEYFEFIHKINDFAVPEEPRVLAPPAYIFDLKDQMATLRKRTATLSEEAA